MHNPRRCWRWGLILAVLVCSQAVPARTSAQDKDQAPAEASGMLGGFAFEMRDRPWDGKDGVLEWLAARAELPIVSVQKPAGTFTFIPPGNLKPRRFALGEIIDI